MIRINFIAALLVLLSYFLCGCAQKPYTGEAAYRTCKKIVNFGARPSGSKNLGRVQDYIKHRMTSNGLDVSEDIFEADTPNGKIQMKNISALIKGREKKARKIIIAAHYESKYFDNFEFVGANDNASGTAILIELAPILAARSYGCDIELLFLDGEEAFGEWSAEDSLYGSKRYVSRIARPKSIKAMVLADMLGDKDLKIDTDKNSDPILTKALLRAAYEIGCENCLSLREINMDDDHIPFIERGIPAVDVIDFSYLHWHTAEDTMDKLSPESLDKAGKILIKMIDILDALPMEE